MAGERLTDVLLGNVFPPTTREGVQLATVRQLAELQAMRGTDLTEEEWRDWRRSVLDDLVSYPHAARALFLGSLACAYIPVGALVTAAVLGSWRWAVAGAGALLLCGVIAYCQGRAFAARRALTAADRRAVVDALIAAGLVSPEEAAELHRRVAERPGRAAEPGCDGGSGSS